MTAPEAKKPLSLDDIAPYPAVRIDARSMGTHYAAFALMHHTLAIELLDFHREREEYNRSSNMAILAYGIAHLFQSLSDIGPAGDQAALELWKDLRHPDGFGADLRTWLAEAGVNPDDVVKVAGEVAANIRAKSSSAALPLGEEA